APAVFGRELRSDSVGVRDPCIAPAWIILVHDSAPIQEFMKLRHFEIFDGDREVVHTDLSGIATGRLEGHIGRAELHISLAVAVLQRAAEDIDEEVSRLLDIADVKLNTIHAGKL